MGMRVVGAGEKFRLCHFNKRNDTLAKEMDNPICDEKQITKVTIPELPLVDVKNARFPYCLVWTPLPVIAWLVPFLGHVGICREDGIILDYGITSNVNINRLEFGSTAKYVRLHPYQCCFPGHSSIHCCKDASCHMERGTSMSWDDALNKTIQLFSNKSYNFFTCNCHSFVVHCMNRMAFQGSPKWNLIDVMLIVLFKGQFVNIGGFIRAYLPFVVVMTFGHVMAGWMFFYAWAMFTFLLVGWFTNGTYAFRGIIDC
ncbi:unnamed protein product [Sphagnum troendelagicum]|uniref:Uncharacterized protein n=1 Tax=Sphagnum troendelagicum TaxID=128251 RepID=A0ABP0U0F8_9BRYO